MSIRRLWTVRGERGGSAAVETVIVIVAVTVLMSVTVAGFRIAMADDAVEGVAGAASRAASLARTAGQARSDAHSVANSSLATEGLNCFSTSVSVNTSGFSVPVGQPASVSVTVSCLVPLQDLLVPGLQGSRLLSASASSPLDVFRERR